VNVALKSDFLTVEDYLTEEQNSQVRHEYLAGAVYAMGGSSLPHNLICANLMGSLYNTLRGGSCFAASNDFKVRVQFASETFFFYPDIVVVCGAKPPFDQQFTENPRVLIEILSRSTARIDRYEKFFAYVQLDSLEEYVLVAQDHPEVTIFRRKNGWRAETIIDIDAELELPSINFTVGLKQIYERIDFDRRG
jgi:Uma2 family endonuclease